MIKIFFKKIQIFFLIIIFLQNQSFAFDHTEKKNEAIKAKEFINIIVDNEIIGSLDDFFDQLRSQSKAIINIRYVDSKFYEKNLIDSNPDIVITKNSFSGDLQKKTGLSEILYLGKLKYTICLSKNGLRDEIQKKIQNINDIEDVANKSFLEVLSNLESILKIYGNMKLGYIDHLKSEKLNLKNIEVLNFKNFISLSVAFKKNKINYAFLPTMLCKKHLLGESDMILIFFDQNSIKSSAQYQIFFKKDFSEIFFGEVGKNFEKLFFFKK
jgi:hypothetical protein